MNIGIVGGGSIGLLLCSYISEKHDVTLYVRRDDQKNALLEHGVQLYEQSAFKRNVRPHISLIEHITTHDCLFICVKQPEILHLVQLLSSVPSNMPIIFLQNGMGHIESIKQLTHPTYVGVVEHGASRMNDVRVNHLGKGKMVLATFNGDKEKAQQLVDNIHQPTFPFQLANDWQTLLANKLIVNAVINPLTALFDVPNGDILENPHIHSIARRLCEEVSGALQLNIEHSWELVCMIANNTKHNTSSMRADVLANRETEIEAMNGYIAKIDPTRHLNYWIYISILALTERGRNYDAR